VGGHAASGNHRSNPEFSEYWVSQCRPTGAFVHDRVPSSRYKDSPVSEFQEILFLNIISAVIVGETRNSFVERDHGPPTGGTASFHSTRWGIVMRAAQSQAPGIQPALAELCRLYWSPLWMFTCVRGLLRRNVSDQAETDEEIHALCEALIASEER
jgi:hypothetical protein